MKTICAIATGNSAGGIGVIRISGENAIEIADRVFTAKDGSPLARLDGYRAKFGSVIIDNRKSDDAVALVFRAPKSYTGEDVVEISVHGGIFIVEKTLEAVLSAGAEPAEAGEFTKRAFLNGKMDLTQAESVADLISAQGETALRASYNALQGSLSNKINNVLENLMDCSALMSAWVDYPDEEIEELAPENLIETLENAKADLTSLVDNYDNGQAMLQGIDTVIAGRPNAGKSTLMNALSGKNKSIVTQIAGTTRDIVEETVRLGTLVLHLNDTAGIRQSDDVVESIGIQRALDKIDSAMLVIAVFDSSAPLSGDDYNLIEKCAGKKAVAIINKTDLNCETDTAVIENAFSKVLYMSAKNNDGVCELEGAVKEILGIDSFDASAPMLANQRQKQCVKNALGHIDEALSASLSGLTYDAVNVMIDSAVDDLLMLTGRKANIEVVNNIFSKFCVGK